jgi:hypothetical protein
MQDEHTVAGCKLIGYLMMSEFAFLPSKHVQGLSKQVKGSTRFKI